MLTEARRLADKIVACALLAIQGTKQSAMLGLQHRGIAAAMQAQTDGEYDILEAMFRRSDIKEGLRAFLEKRNPNFEGR